MSGVFWTIFLALIWIVVPIIVKKKQQEARERAARERAAMQRAAQAKTQQPAPKATRTGPIAPTVHPTVGPSAFDSPEGPFSRSVSPEGRASREEGTPAHTLGTLLTTKESTLKQIHESPQHVVEASSISGHAHEETSMTGIRPPCPPDAQTAPKPPSSAPGGEAGFVWRQNEVLSGIVMAEILGPCVAMRE